MAENEDTPQNSRLKPLRLWLVERLGLVPIKRHVLDHRESRSPWTYGDGSSLLMLFLVLVATGSFLALGYSPAPESAYESVQAVTSSTVLGWFMRALHYWSGGMMVVMSMAHLFRHILLGGYKPPREGTWLVGLLMFVLVLTNSFIGYTLRWDERSLYAIGVALQMFYRVPIIGDALVTFIQGGFHVGAPTLSRLYAVHVLFVPLGIFALVGYHLYLVIIHGVTTMAERRTPVETSAEQKVLRDRMRFSKTGGHEFYPYTVAKSGSFALCVFLVVLLLALVLGPAELYPKANYVSSSFPVEEWWWHWYSALIAYLPPWAAAPFYVAFPTLTFLFLFLLPFVDRGANRGYRHRPFAVAFVVTAIASSFILTGLRLRSPWTGWPTKNLAPLPEGAVLSEEAAEGHRLFTVYGCHNCHALGGHGARVGPNLSSLDTRLSLDELRKFILNPPKGAAMPAYEGHLSESELSRIASFVLVAQTFPREYKAK